MNMFVDTSDSVLVDLLALPPGKTHERTDRKGVSRDSGVRAAWQASADSRNGDLDRDDDVSETYAIVDRWGLISWMTPPAARLLGEEPGRLPDQSLGARLASENERAVLAAIARVLATGEAETIAVRLGRPPQPQCDLHLMIRPETAHRTPKVPPTACRLDTPDSAEVAQARATVAAQQGFFQSVIDGIGDPVLVLGIDRRVWFMNRAARAAPAGGGVGLPCYRVAYGCDRPCDSLSGARFGRCPACSVLAGGVVAKAIHRLPGADGQTRWMEVVCAPLHGPAGEVLGVIETFHDITAHVTLSEQLKERERELARLVEHDPLTGLPNRLLFSDRLDQTLRLADRERRQAALLFVDLDRFKSINDRFGHAVGDQVLIRAAQRMRAAVRASDTVARLGGDEFAVVLGVLEDDDDAGLVAQKLVEAFEQPLAVDGRMLHVTASIGIGRFPHDGSDADALLRHADAAMYRAKSQGRDTFRY